MIEISNKDNYKNTIASNLYDYIVIAEDNSEFNDDFISELTKVALEYSPDIIYSDYIKDHKQDHILEKIRNKTIIFGELKSKPNFIKNAAIKISVIKKYGIDINTIIRPANNLLLWHIPKFLFKLKED
jgi:hypothetical protein